MAIEVLCSAFIWLELFCYEFFSIDKHLFCSKTSSFDKAGVIGLGGINLFGVIILGAMLKYSPLSVFLSTCASCFLSS